jgi:cytochrome c
VRAAGLAALAAALAWPAGAQPDEAARGEVVFQRCFACHSVKAGEVGPPAPNLHGVVGRRAASLPGYEYSDALKALSEDGLIWTEAALDKYLTDAEAMAPGTSMLAPGLSDPAERRAVIAYLKAHR